MASEGGSKVWSVVSVVAALAAVLVARKTINATWRAATGKNPPENPADPDVDVTEAVLWAAVSGTVVALARMLAQRRAASYYRRTTGKLPPQLEKGNKVKSG
jgi:hypothetical protein